MEQFCLAKGIVVDEWINEVGGGLNFKRKLFLDLMDRINTGEIKEVYVAHKDRLARFSYDYFEHFCKQNDCELIAVNQPSLSPQQEMIEDMLAIIHSFSSRLYGLRKYKKEFKSMVNETKNA